MTFLDLTLPSLAENLALDEALLLGAESGDGSEVLRFWEWPYPAVILGSGGKLHEDVDEEACQTDSVPILRRGSGGGTVLLGQGCLIYSLILSFQRDPTLTDIRASYRYLLGRVGTVLGEGFGGVEPAGISDMVYAGRKFSGTAQQRKRSFLLHHGTLLYEFDLTLIPQYLREPTRQPEYRAGRSHLAFVCNLPLNRAEIKHRFRQAWGANDAAMSWPEELAQRLVADKYARPEWTTRR